MNAHSSFRRKYAAICVGLALTSSIASAQQEIDDSEKSKDSFEQILVTGSRSGSMTVLESSVAVTVLEEKDLIRKSPRSTADALELIPGFIVEDTGGEVSNNYTVRGLIGGSQFFVQLLEDGLPVKYRNALVDAIVKYDVTMDRVEAIRGGTSGVLTVQGAGAAVNFISKRIGEDAEGVIRLTGSDYGTKKAEFYYGAPLGGNWYGSIGGTYRTSDGIRDPGFTADRGGNFKFRLENRFDDGKIGVTYKHVDENNTFFLPTPFQNFENPTPLPGFDALNGTMLSLDNAVMVGRASPESGRGLTRTHDLTEGFVTKATQIGFYLEKGISDDVVFNMNSRYIDQEFTANAVFTFDNNAIYRPQDRIDPNQFSDVAAMLERFGPAGAVRAGVSYVGGPILTDQEMSNLNGNGLMTLGISRSPFDSTKEFVNDLSVTWTTDQNTMTAGVLYFDTRFERAESGMLQFLMDVSDNSRRMDIVALNDENEVVGYLTENGALDYGAWGESNASIDQQSTSLYVNNEYEYNDELRIDFGIRHETLKGNEKFQLGAGSAPVVGAFDENGDDVDNIIANNFILNTASTNFGTNSGDVSKTTFSVGGNYTLSDNLAIYGRFTSTHNMEQAWQDPIDLDFTELGIRYRGDVITTSITLFNSEFDFFPLQLGERGTDTFVRANRSFSVNGAEFDFTWTPTDFLRFDVIGMLQAGEIDGFDFVEGNSALLGNLTTAFGGLSPARSPEETLALTGSYFLNDSLEVYLSGQYIGDRFADDGNTITLPSYTVIDAGVIYDISDDLVFNVNVSNLTDEIGLTEGNPRGGVIERPQGETDVFYARSIPGRNIVFSLTYSF